MAIAISTSAWTACCANWRPTTIAVAFVSALALCWPDGHCELFEAWVEGEILEEKRGTRGFGYDPIFRPLGYTETFGEMDPAQKQEISHRAETFRQLLAACFVER